MGPADYEKLGVFYLGRLYDLAAGEGTDDPLLYDSRDLLTHAVCVGMTGSGKTGLCIGLLEEAALDGVPAIAIDPKGDLGNLLLTFPDLRPEDFRPWIEEEEASRKGRTPEEHAAAVAASWRNGLEAWGQDGERIRRLRESAEFAIYTPGSSAGIPLSVMGSFAAPPAAIREDAELLGERIETAATSLLGLLGVDADPIRSREHILVSTILHRAWSAGRDLDVGSLIQAIQSPPVERIGVLDVEAFYPSDDRFDLAMKLNNLLAAPGFETWREGAPMDVDQLLFTAEGGPRISIVSIAHLGEAERMFVVSLLLEEIVGWMRAQPGTSSLRAILYMDEIFGFFPPVAEPPSKKPLLTMLKQARAYGLGVVLATQNPVDLDYKGLSNAGTWFLGRLQTERDKARVMEGLEGVSAGGGFDRGAMEETLAGLGKRVFLMHDVHEDAPVTFETRWVMSYLKGPMTRREIERLTPVRGIPPGRTEPGPTRETPIPAAERARDRPVLPPDVPEHFAPARPSTGSLTYRPVLYGAAEVRYVDRGDGVDETRRFEVAFPILEATVPIAWDEPEELDLEPEALADRPAEGAAFATLPSEAARPERWREWEDEFADWIYRSRTLTLWRSPTFDALSRPGETEREFRIRLRQLARERRDEEAEKLRATYRSKVTRLQERERKALQRIEREADQAQDARLQTAISLGATLLGSILGGKGISRSTVGRATTAARGVGRSVKQSKDVQRAEEDARTLRDEIERVDAGLREDLDQLEARFDPLAEEFQEVGIEPYKKNISVRLVTLVWMPA